IDRRRDDQVGHERLGLARTGTRRPRAPGARVTQPATRQTADRAAWQTGAAGLWLVGRVLRLDLLAADLGDRVVGGDRRLAHADRDQRDLAGIARGVARGVDARQVRLARGRVD